MSNHTKMQSFFFWLLWTVGMAGNITIVYGFMTHSLDSLDPLAVWFICLFFTISPFIVLYDGAKRSF
jgi:hypothetical protein